MELKKLQWQLHNEVLNKQQQKAEKDKIADLKEEIQTLTITLSS